MSIEALIQAQIDALKENTAAVLLLEASLVGRAGGNSKPAAKDDKPKVESKAEVKEEKKPEPEVKEEIIYQDENGNELINDGAATSYETLRELVLKLASGGKRDEIKAVSAKHGITAPKDLLKDPADMSSVTDQAKLEAVYADLLALEA